MKKSDIEELAETFVHVWNNNSDKVTKSDYAKQVEKDIINKGWCYQFALVLKEVRPDARLITTCDHAYVVIDDKCYDSDNHGIPVGEYKPFCWCQGCKGGQQVEIEYFAEGWRLGGRSGEVQWDIIRSTAATWKAHNELKKIGA